MYSQLGVVFVSPFYINYVICKWIEWQGGGIVGLTFYINYVICKFLSTIIYSYFSISSFILTMWYVNRLVDI